MLINSFFSFVFTEKTIAMISWYISYGLSVWGLSHVLTWRAGPRRDSFIWSGDLQTISCRWLCFCVYVCVGVHMNAAQLVCIRFWTRSSNRPGLCFQEWTLKVICLWWTSHPNIQSPAFEEKLDGWQHSVGGLSLRSRAFAERSDDLLQGRGTATDIKKFPLD